MSVPQREQAGLAVWKKPRVWIVDDDEAFCVLLEMILDEYPTQFFTALDTLDRAFDRDLPEILLLDLMFGRDLHAVVKYLEYLHQHHPSILVVVVSSSKDQRDVYRTGQLHSFEFVEKGAPEQHFHEELLRVVERAERQCTVNHLLSHLFGLTDLIRAFTGKPAEKCDPVVRLILQCFLSCISETGPSVKAIAERVGISPSTIREHFHMQFRSGPSETLRIIALLIAGTLIIRGFKVAEAADVVGMSPERLRQRFHAEFECPPSRAHEHLVFHDLGKTYWLYNTPFAKGSRGNM